MKYNYQILVEYEGTKYFGWQIQKKKPTIQGILQTALKKYFKKKITVIGAGRTDTGVHANAQSAHFFSSSKIEKKYKFLSSINFFLKKHNISILDIKKKRLNFHSRFSAKQRVYKYLIINRLGDIKLNKKRAWHIKNDLNLNRMKKGAKLLSGTKDFSTFRSSSCSAKSPIKTLKKVKVSKKGHLIEITFISKSFLQHQVRSMVGCLKYLSEGKWSLTKFKYNMLSKNRSNCAPPAPPEGLFLVRVIY